MIRYSDIGACPSLPPSFRPHLFDPVPIRPSLYPFLHHRRAPEQASGEGGIEGANGRCQAREEAEVWNVSGAGERGGREGESGGD